MHKEMSFLLSSETRLVNIYGIFMNERASRKLASQSDARWTNVLTDAGHSKKCFK